MRNKSGTRRNDFAHNVIGRADDECGNTESFDHMRDKTDGLMAKRSVRYQQR